MTENEAIKLAVENSEKHFMPIDKREDYELAVIQTIGDIYKMGYEVVPRFVTKLTLGDIERMKEEGVIY